MKGGLLSIDSGKFSLKAKASGKDKEFTLLKTKAIFVSRRRKIISGGGNVGTVIVT